MVTHSSLPFLAVVAVEVSDEDCDVDCVVDANVVGDVVTEEEMEFVAVELADVDADDDADDVAEVDRVDVPVKLCEVDAVLDWVVVGDWDSVTVGLVDTLLVAVVVSELDAVVLTVVVAVELCVLLGDVKLQCRKSPSAAAVTAWFSHSTLAPHVAALYPTIMLPEPNVAEKEPMK